MLWVCFCKSNNPTKKKHLLFRSKAQTSNQTNKKTIIVKIKIPKQATKPTKNPVQNLILKFSIYLKYMNINHYQILIEDRGEERERERENINHYQILTPTTFRTPAPPTTHPPPPSTTTHCRRYQLPTTQNEPATTFHQPPSCLTHRASTASPAPTITVNNTTATALLLPWVAGNPPVFSLSFDFSGPLFLFRFLWYSLSRLSLSLQACRL